MSWRSGMSNVEQAALLREDASQGQERLQRDRDLRAAEARSEAQRRNDSNGK